MCSVFAGKDTARACAPLPFTSADIMPRGSALAHSISGLARLRAGGDRRVLAQAFRTGIAAAIVTCCMPFHAPAQTGSTISLDPMTLEGAFMGKKKDKPAADISGIACMPPVGTKRTCLLVNDENKNAQFATIEEGRLIAGNPIVLIGDEPDTNPKKTLGMAPDVGCPKGPGDFGEFDGEGVAYSQPFFYVIGSHGCSRNSEKFRLSSFMLARIRVDDQGRPADGEGKPLPADRTADAVQTTYRVSDVLQRARSVAGFFGKALNSANGLNIEGMAVDGDKVWFGLRAPVDGDGKAFLISGSLSDLFRDGHSPSQKSPEDVIDVRLANLGIRDLAMLRDRCILVLAGAAHGPEEAFQLFVVDTKVAKPIAKPLGQLPEVKRSVEGEMTVGKAEAVTVLDPDQGQIVVLFDALLDGAPRLAKVSLQ